MKKLILFFLASIVFYSCSSSLSESNTASGNTGSTVAESVDEGATSGYDAQRGEGKFDNVELADNLDVTMATGGKVIADVKCTSCHKMTDERLVGPGWKGVTERRKPQWIMNFITNPDPMIDKDPALQAQLELCLVRMPNQSLTDDDARHILEYMRQNDGAK